MANEQVKKFLKVLSWQEAHAPLSVSEKARLMALGCHELDDELHRMSEEFHRERYGL